MGCFPFVTRIREKDVEGCIFRLKGLKKETVTQFIDSVRRKWDVDRKTKKSLKILICQRATFVADNIMSELTRILLAQSAL